MKIERAEVIVSSPDRNFVTLRLTTASGTVGLGDATLNGRELAVASYLADHVVPLLLGRDAARIEDTWQFLYRSAYWRRGPVTMTAIAAVDTALWDIKGKTAGLPVYELLGGASREGLLAYGHASGESIPELLDSVRSYQEAGFRAFRIQAGVPGLGQIYGVHSAEPGNDDDHYEPAIRGPQPAQEAWDTRAYLRHVPAMFEAVRAEFGAEPPLLHDGHHRMRPIEAAQLGRSLEPFDAWWLEDCTPGENQEALRLVRSHTTTPLAIGEVFNSMWDYDVLIREQLIDYVRSSVTHAGGITHLRRILDLADMYQIRSGMHGPTDISPVGMAAALHLGLAIHNFGIQEYMPHGSRTGEVFQQSYSWANGMLHPGSEPGLGVTLDVDEAGKYPYEQAYLPFTRLADGTIHDW